jgi:hypothetical protein
MFIQQKRKGPPLTLLLNIAPHKSSISGSFLRSTIFVFIKTKYQDTTEKLKKGSGSSPIFALYKKNIYSHTRTDVTVPFNT